MFNGYIDRHYFLQDIYLAKKVINQNPSRHFDIGSRVDGFIAHLLSGYDGEVTLLDIRPLQMSIDNLNFIQTDATNLDGIEDNSIDSISSLHAVEHFGLGRYGDSIDIDAYRKVTNSIQRVVKKGGYVYFSVPIGKRNAIYFNSHRQFSPYTVSKLFDKLKLIEFSYIHDYKINTIEFENSNYDLLKKLNIFDYDCGMFIFKK